MLIVLGGFLGSGRQVLARKLSTRLGFHYYDIGQKRLHYNVLDKRGNARERTQRLSTDGLRLDAYRRVVQDLPMLSKMYPDTVIDGVFHRAKPREYLFSEAERYFDPIVFVWVDSDEESVHTRIEWLYKKRLIEDVESAIERRERNKKDFEPFKTEPLRFFNHGSPRDSSERLRVFIEESISMRPSGR